MINLEIFEMADKLKAAKDRKKELDAQVKDVNEEIAPKHEEQTYNSYNGILHMCKNQSKLMLEEIAKNCVENNACRYSYFKKLLKNEQNNHSGYSSYTLPEHNNLRGKEEYR